MAVRPIGDRVVVEVLEQEETRVGSIILTAASTDDLSKGRVVSVGNGGFSFQGERLPLDVAVDDVVLFPSFRGQVVRDTDATLLRILDEKDILAIIS